MIDKVKTIGTQQQFSAVNTNTPAGGDSGGEEEKKKLRARITALAAEIGGHVVARTEAEAKVAGAEQAALDAQVELKRVVGEARDHLDCMVREADKKLAETKSGLERVISSLKDEVGELHTRLCNVLSAGSAESAEGQILALRMEVEKARLATEVSGKNLDQALVEREDLRLLVDGKVVEIADLNAQLSAEQARYEAAKKVADDFDTKLSCMEIELSIAKGCIKEMKKHWWVRKRDEEVVS